MTHRRIITLYYVLMRLIILSRSENIIIIPFTDTKLYTSARIPLQTEIDVIE